MASQNAFAGSMPKCLSGFEDINRYWDNKHNKYVAKILPGQYYVSNNDELIATVLGSCISVCITDPIARIGGMNHFMLPKYDSRNEDAWGSTVINAQTRYGNVAMEHLINKLIAHGAHKPRLELKVIGGGRVMREMTDVGLRNISFVYDYIADEHLKLVKEDVGDLWPRKVLFHPMNGKVWVRKLRKLANETILERDMDYMEQLQSEKIEGSVDLF